MLKSIKVRSAPANSNIHLGVLKGRVSVDSKDHPIYIWPWVKSPGVYKFKEGTSVADVVKMAGGFIPDARVAVVADSLADYISIYRPTKDIPDPTKPFFTFDLDWAKPNGGIAGCEFKLKPKDLIVVAFR